MKTVFVVIGVCCALGGALFLLLYVPYLVNGQSGGIFGTFLGAILLGVGVVTLLKGTKKDDQGGWDGPEW